METSEKFDILYREYDRQRNDLSEFVMHYKDLFKQTGLYVTLFSGAVIYFLVEGKTSENSQITFILAGALYFSLGIACLLMANNLDTLNGIFHMEARVAALEMLLNESLPNTKYFVWQHRIGDAHRKTGTTEILRYKGTRLYNPAHVLGIIAFLLFFFTLILHCILYIFYCSEYLPFIFCIVVSASMIFFLIQWLLLATVGIKRMRKRIYEESGVTTLSSYVPWETKLPK